MLYNRLASRATLPSSPPESSSSYSAPRTQSDVLSRISTLRAMYSRSGCIRVKDERQNRLPLRLEGHKIRSQTSAGQAHRQQITQIDPRSFQTRTAPLSLRYGAQVWRQCYRDARSLFRPLRQIRERRRPLKPGVRSKATVVAAISNSMSAPSEYGRLLSQKKNSSQRKPATSHAGSPKLTISQSTMRTSWHVASMPLRRMLSPLISPWITPVLCQCSAVRARPALIADDD